MTSFTDGKPRKATEKDCKASWCGGKPGEHFRCSFCGKKFQIGDIWRFQYTNDIKGTIGNPLVCEKCDEGHERTREKWVKKCHEFRCLENEWWWFIRNASNC